MTTEVVTIKCAIAIAETDILSQLDFVVSTLLALVPVFLGGFFVVIHFICVYLLKRIITIISVLLFVSLVLLCVVQKLWCPFGNYHVKSP